MNLRDLCTPDSSERCCAGFVLRTTHLPRRLLWWGLRQLDRGRSTWNIRRLRPGLVREVRHPRVLGEEIHHGRAIRLVAGVGMGMGGRRNPGRGDLAGPAPRPAALLVESVIP